MRRAFFLCMAVVIAMALFLPFVAYSAPVGTVTRVEGRVDVLKAGQTAVSPVAQGNVVDVCDIYRSKTDGRAEITFFNKNILRIAPATRVQISRYSDEGDRSDQIMKLERGKVEAVSGEEFIKKVSSFAEGNRFEVHTPNAVAGIRGSGMIVGYQRLVTGLFFSTGRGYFYNPASPAQIVNVSAGFMSFITGPGGLPTRPRPGNMAYVGGGDIAPAGGGDGDGPGGPGFLALGGYFNSSYVFTQQLIDVPGVFVGSIPYLHGSTGSTDWIMVSLNDVKFYGPSATSQPQSWQATSVSGSFGGNPSLVIGSPFAISGSGASASFTLNNLAGGVWSGSVTDGEAPGGVGAYTQPVGFSGTASGTYSGSTMSGTASGTAGPGPF